ncbi:MAG: hypothetical protein GC185_09405 [Alphaproteobacteria bacterium]|nr:hypothetical protein [Alphaproteobacteria bacterium]
MAEKAAEENKAEEDKKEEKPAAPSRSEAMTFAFAGGMAVWALVSAFGNSALAWDSGLYYFLGMPVLVFFAALLGYHFPQKAYRHGLWLALGQFAAMVVIGLIRRNGFGLILYSVVAAYALSVPLQLAAIAAAWFGRHNGPQKEAD